MNSPVVLLAHPPAKIAFSLVELSIVLVILGLLVGGVLGGKSLIRAAELRKVKTSIDKYIAATYAFRDKYQCLPGDCATFSKFFSAASNGNGSGMIGGVGDGSTDEPQDPLPYNFSELLLAWNHLSLAGLIEGQYSGDEQSNGGLGGYYRVGTDVPASGLGSNGYYQLRYQGQVTSDYAYIPKGSYGNCITPLSWRGTFQLDSIGANLTEQEVATMDLKYDDGKPRTGIIRIGLGQNYDSTTATYDFSVTAMGYSPIFITGF